MSTSRIPSTPLPSRYARHDAATAAAQPAPARARRRTSPPAGGFTARRAAPAAADPAYGRIPRHRSPGQGARRTAIRRPRRTAPQTTAYGYPAQPTQPQYLPPQPGGGGGKKFNAQLQIIVAAAVAIVLIIGGGVWYRLVQGRRQEGRRQEQPAAPPAATGRQGRRPTAGGKEKAPANPASKVAFQLPAPDAHDLTSVSGSWVTDKAYVKTGVNSIVGYDPAKGTPLWTIPLPGQVCAACRHVTEDNKTAIALRGHQAQGRPQSTRRAPRSASSTWPPASCCGRSPPRATGDEKVSFDRGHPQRQHRRRRRHRAAARPSTSPPARVRWKPKADAEQLLRHRVRRRRGAGRGPQVRLSTTASR